jgi:hypothetical protein
VKPAAVVGITLAVLVFVAGFAGRVARAEPDFRGPLILSTVITVVAFVVVLAGALVLLARPPLRLHAALALRRPDSGIHVVSSNRDAVSAFAALSPGGRPGIYFALAHTPEGLEIWVHRGELRLVASIPAGDIQSAVLSKTRVAGSRVPALTMRFRARGRQFTWPLAFSKRGPLGYVEVSESEIESLVKTLTSQWQLSEVAR